jgi:hypothetical protein
MVAAFDRQGRTEADGSLVRVSWFFDAGYHVRAGDAEEHNLDTWTKVRRWLGSQDKPILADPRDVLTRLYNSEINGCVAEVPEGSYIVALGDEHNGFDAERRAETWDGALRWLGEQARVCYPKSRFTIPM